MAGLEPADCCAITAQLHTLSLLSYLLAPELSSRAFNTSVQRGKRNAKPGRQLGAAPFANGLDSPQMNSYESIFTQ